MCMHGISAADIRLVVSVMIAELGTGCMISVREYMPIHNINVKEFLYMVVQIISAPK